ncbi:hypothetical protein [Bacillus sp. FJAT-49736]|uniref:BC1872 family protein n=1 Tax=Bacillus sp. FJAT-49736 TaxID=2833582 RepID=UPI001BC9D843|nr:hypothetical protein [Bacillus sp. FJAT-49736]MBS4171913.1 hypothetical protein [Bacillus sp. FJAT-49736]
MENREIDKLVAEKVMGYRFDSTKSTYFKNIGHGWENPVFDFHPSEDIASAWLIIEELYKRKQIRMFVSNNFHPLWEARCKKDTGDWIGHGFDEETAPLAICKAALNVVGVEVN